MKIEQNKSLKSYTTFAVNVTAKYFAEIITNSDMYDLVNSPLWKEEKHYILGGGSNILFTKDFDGIIVYNNLRGIEVINENTESVTVKVSAGENWHKFVIWAVDRKLWGVENLVLIPGYVGAAPVQNIGAYGVEVKDTIISINVIDIISGEESTFMNNECNFGYRTSLFKNESKYFVTSVTFKLLKQGQAHLEYGAITTKLEEHNISHPTIKQLADAIIEIRQSKLPDPRTIGTAGSFFKNPIVSKKHAEKLLEKYPEMKYFDLPDNQVKIPAGWLIEELGYRGVKEGNVGTYDKHALVLVNYGDATGVEVWEFAQKIMTHVYKVFDINLEPEVLVI